jgi:hypothetical protein
LIVPSVVCSPNHQKESMDLILVALAVTFVSRKDRLKDGKSVCVDCLLLCLDLCNTKWNIIQVFIMYGKK